MVHNHRKKMPSDTFCENYVPWLEHLKPLAEHLDVISIHTYPVWAFKMHR